jgi:hypothetical protein
MVVRSEPGIHRTMKHSQSPHSVTKRLAFACWLVFFTLFVLNVLAGKWSAASGQAIWHLERVPEFLLLFASAISFAVAALAAEGRNSSGTSTEPLENQAPT